MLHICDNLNEQGQVKQPGDAAAASREGTAQLEEVAKASANAKQKKRRWRYFWGDDDQED